MNGGPGAFEGTDYSRAAARPAVDAWRSKKQAGITRSGVRGRSADGAFAGPFTPWCAVGGSRWRRVKGASQE